MTWCRYCGRRSNSSTSIISSIMNPINRNLNRRRRRRRRHNSSIMFTSRSSSSSRLLYRLP